MIDIKDLQIGDWVFDGDEGARVTSLTCDGIIETTRRISNIEVVTPIPLTPEILEKNGFESTSAPSERVWKRNGQEVWLDNEGKNYWANIKNGEFYFEGYIEHVHELQHAIRLCRIEKEIEL